tara:strand:- start:678 stop:839 length:162 start_codon:yes stop_codon:yes gene_type:complete
MENLGSASIKIELQNNTITVYHGDDNTILHQAKATNKKVWERIWESIRKNTQK